MYTYDNLEQFAAEPEKGARHGNWNESQRELNQMFCNNHVDTLFEK